MDRLTDPAQGYCEMYCEKYGIPGCDPETCARKSEVAMYERLKDIEGIVPFERLVELAFADRGGRCAVYHPGYPVASHYYQDEDGLCIREVSGVVSKEEYEAALKGEQDG